MNLTGDYLWHRYVLSPALSVRFFPFSEATPTPLRGFVYMRLIRLRLNVLALRGQPLPQRSKRTAKVFAPRDRLHSLRSPSLPRKRGTPSGAFGHADGSRAVYGYGRAKF